MRVAAIVGKGAPPRRFPGRGMILEVLCVLAAAWWTPLGSSAAEPQPSAPLLVVDLSPNHEDGLLDPGRPFECSVRLKGLKPRQNEELVAIFESLAYPHRLVAFTPEDGSADLTASATFEPRLTTGADGQPLRMEVVVARLKGMRLETVFSRAVYLTTVPAPSEPETAIPAPSPGTVLLETIVSEAPATDRAGRPVQPLLPEEDIVVEELGSAPTGVSAPVYWKQIGESVARHWQQRRAELPKEQAARGLRVQFRLYPRGFAQLIQVERSSGNPNVDEAGLRTVLGLHPFPPFPPDIREPSVDVHVDLPRAKR